MSKVCLALSLDYMYLEFWVLFRFLRGVLVLWSAAKPKLVHPIRISVTLRKSKSSTRFVLVCWVKENTYQFQKSDQKVSE